MPTAPSGPGRRGSLALMRERRRDALGMFTRLRDEHGDVVRFRMGPLDMYLVTDLDLVQEVLTTHAASFRKGRMLEGARVLLGDGLLTAEGEHHRRQRRLMQPAFHRERMAGYADIMARCSAEAAGRLPVGRVVDVHSEMTALTMGITAEALFGADLAGERERVEVALADVLRAFDLLVLPLAGLRMRLPTRTVRRFRAARVELETLVDRVIAERRAAGGDRGDLLSMLLLAQDAEGAGGMSDDEVRHEVMTLLAAGLETTANALTFAWWLLAGHPEAERRVHAEVDALPADRPGLDDLPRLGFTRMVLHEAIRLYPPAWMIARRCVGAVALGGYEIPEGGLVMMPPWLIHRDPRQWPHPESFDPERFADGDAAGRHRYAYLPFGAGTRKCIGSAFADAEGTLALAAIARRRTFAALPGRVLALEPQITLRPRGGLPMTVGGRPSG